MEELIKNKAKTTSWVIFIVILLSGFMIINYESLNLAFLSLLIAELITVILFFKKFSVTQIHISRLLIGCLFIFSGFVKGVDPVGTNYRIIDYFIAFGTDWAMPVAMPLSILLNATEFMLGIVFLLNIRIRFTSWLVLIMMVFFTLITLNDALNNPVPDCGCFGDALLISNWQTIYKNLVIDALLLIVFLSRKRIRPAFGSSTEGVLVILFLAGFVFFEVYNIRHLPVIDFRAWKIGNSVVNENPLPSKFYVTYRNKATGETREYLSPDYPYNDSTWVKHWEFVGQRVVNPNPPANSLMLEDSLKEDVTSEILENPDWQFMLISYDLSKASLKNIKRIRDLIKDCNNKGISFVLVTASQPETASEFIMNHRLDVDVYFADDVTLMAMIRSNPGLILLKNGVVMGKWHNNDIPDFNYFRMNFFSKSSP